MPSKNAPHGDQAADGEGPDGTSLDATNLPSVESTVLNTLRSLGAETANPRVVLGEGAVAKLKESLQSEERKYVLEGELGQGGMGTVYRVRDCELNRSLAMKVIRIPGSDASAAVMDEGLLSRFLEEAQVTGQLDHPGIVPLHELGVDPNGRIYFTMRLVRGMHLGQLFDAIHKEQGGKDGWTIDRALVVMMKVCDALAYAHSKGVIHRDLKPANIMAGRFGEAYVMDWGLAKVSGRKEVLIPRPDTTQMTQSLVKTRRSQEGTDSEFSTEYGSVFGTPSYMAPEQARGELEIVDHLSDIYSMGAILYRLLTGQSPYVPKNARVEPHMVLRWALEGPPKPIREIAPKIPPELAAIAEKAMSREREDRYRSADELGADIRQYLRGRPVTALRFGPVARTVRWCRKNPMVAGLLLAVTVGGTVGLKSLSSLSSKLVQESALESVGMKSEILEAVNALYSSEIVGRVDRDHVEVTHDYSDKGGAIPLPATFLTSLGKQISTLQSGVDVHHYSDFPFDFRGDEGGPRDDFEREAMVQLRKDPTKPFYEFTKVDNKPVLRFATARVLVASCIDCHNTYPGTPKTDWKVGDVRGVLEIIRPLEQDHARTQAGLQGTFLTIASIVVGLMAVSALVLIQRTRAA